MLHIKDMQMTDYTTIRVGIGSSRAPYILPVILELFRKHDTQTNIVVFELTTDEIKQRLLKSEIEVPFYVFGDAFSFKECDVKQTEICGTICEILSVKHDKEVNKTLLKEIK